ncbi:MAG: hypothetical protein K6F33_07340 [Bacteroidales bacterium]|nr:hypothetical protein [Bacteroidales bacterium]
MQAVTFTQSQIHLLNMVSHIKTEQSFDRLKEQLASLYAQLIDNEMDELWDSGQWNEQKLADLRHAHYRTPYSK